MGHLYVRRWVLRGLFLAQLLAFLSLAPQVLGLYGETGVLPAQAYLDRVAGDFGRVGYTLVPTLFWFDASDLALEVACGLGVVSALLGLIGWWPRLTLALGWILYLSLSSVGRVFLAFQWDLLLLEATVVVWLLAPRGIWPGLRADDPPRPLALALGRLLLFKLIFLSGYSKWASGDPSWRGLTALTYHYQTQPLPTVLAVYFHELPRTLQQASAAVTLLIQLGVPWLLGLPPKVRRWAYFPLAGQQVLIALTGSYGFFNLLALVLCLYALDDGALLRACPPSLRALVPALPAPPKPRRGWLPELVAATLLVLQVSLLFGRVFGGEHLPGPIAGALEALRPLRSLNSYGLFAVMTTERDELVLEGSRDGQDWRPYVFPFQPGPVERAPVWAAPHLPRLDWQLWFAALGEPKDSPWLRPLLARLLEGVPEVRRLLAVDPFGDDPPNSIRVRRYRYRFATPTERAQQGVWWVRDDRGRFFPPYSLSGSL